MLTSLSKIRIASILLVFLCGCQAKTPGEDAAVSPTASLAIAVASPVIIAWDTAPPTPTVTPAVMTPAPTVPTDIVAPKDLSEKQRRLYVLQKQIEAVGGRESPVGKPLFTEWLDTMLTPAQKQRKLSDKECRALAYMANSFCSVNCFAWPEELTAETLLDIAGSYYHDSGFSCATPPAVPARASGFSLEFPIYAEENVNTSSSMQYNTRHAETVHIRFSTMDKLLRSMVDVSLPPLSDTESYSFLPTDLMEIADGDFLYHDIGDGTYAPFVSAYTDLGDGFFYVRIGNDYSENPVGCWRFVVRRNPASVWGFSVYSELIPLWAYNPILTAEQYADFATVVADGPRAS